MQGESRVSPVWAEQHGYTIDRSCYPWAAYKGRRFNPTDLKPCYTRMEWNQLETINRLMLTLAAAAFVIACLLVWWLRAL